MFGLGRLYELTTDHSRGFVVTQSKRHSVAPTQFKSKLIAAAVVGSLTLLAAERSNAQVTVNGGCDSYIPSQGQTVVCSVEGSNPDAKGVQTPENNKTINDVTVIINEGVVLDVNGSNIGLGAGTTVRNSGTLYTRKFRYGYGMSAGVNGRSTAGGNDFTNEVSGIVLTDGADAHGMYINARLTSATDNAITNAGVVTTTGNRSDGIRLYTTASDATNVIVNSGSITTSGDQAHGINVLNTSNLVDINLTSTGSVMVSGPGAVGVYIDGSANVVLSGSISSAGDAIYVDPDADNPSATTVTLLSGASMTGDIVLSTAAARTQETLVFDGFVADATASFDNALTGVNRIDAIGNADVVLGDASYSFGQASITVDDTSTLQINGVIDADTSVTKLGEGDLILAAANQMTNTVTISAGILQLNSNTAAGSGQISIADGASLKMGVAGLNVGNDIDLIGANQLDTGDFAATLSGVISGAGGLTKEGTGTLILSGANTYSGGSTISEGVLSAQNNDALGTAQVTVAHATLQLALDGMSISNAIELQSSASKIATADNDATLLGLISGTGGLTKTGTGTLTLSGTNTYSGGTTVTAGVVAINQSSSAGTGVIDVRDDATLQVNTDMTLINTLTVSGNATFDTQANDVTIPSVISGTGKLIKAGTGTLTLVSANTYAGGTQLRAGTVVVASDQALGDGVLQASGADVVLVAGKSNLTLGNAVSLNEDLIVDTAGEFVLLNGEITGAGRLIKQGAGTLELAGDNTFSGGTRVETGTLALDINPASSTGEVVMAADTVLQANATLVLDNVFKLRGPVEFNTQGFDVTLNNRISNNSVGQLIKTGSGVLTLNGSNDYTGGTIIQQGTLALYGSLASGVTVQAGTLLGGSGTVTGDVTNAGLIQPRLNGARGTLTIVGSYVGQGGMFVSTLSGTPGAIEADQLAFEGIGNTVSGSTAVTLDDPNGVLGKPTDGNGVLLVGVSAGATSTLTAFTSPRIAVGAYEYRLVRGGEDSPDSWYLRADANEPQPPVVITPEASQREEVALYPSLPSLARQYLWSISGTLDDRRGAPDIVGQWDQQPMAWARLIAQHNETKPGNANDGPGLEANDWGLQLGADLWRSDSAWGQWRVGPVMTIGRSTGSAYNTSGSVQTGDISLNAYSLGLNATVASDQGAYADLLLLGTRLTGVQASSPLGTSINTTGWAFSGSLEGGWRMPLNDQFAITPQAQIYTTTVSLKDGGDAYSLVQMPSATTVLGRVGLKLSYDKIQASGSRMQFWARASVYSTLSGRDASTSFLNTEGRNATTFQSQAPGAWMALEAAINLQATDNTQVQLGLGYQGTFNDQYRGMYGQISVKVGF